MAERGRAGVGRDDDSDPARRHLSTVDGVERALAVAGIEDVIITAKEGQRLVPLPEGSSYLGFIFARGESPEEVEEALRRSHAELRFRHRDRARDVQPFVLGGTKSGGSARLRRRNTCPSAR